MASFHFANTFYTLYCECILYYRSKHKHKKSCFVNARILESFYKKGKKLRKKMKKWQIENSEKSEISEILEKLFRVLLVPSFRFCPTAEIKNSDLRILEKSFRDFRDFRVFRVFDLDNKELNCISSPIARKIIFAPNSQRSQKSSGEKKKRQLRSVLLFRQTY